MTEEQMEKRIKDINEEMKKLRLEQKEYEKYFSDKKEKEKLESRQNFVGKCYISKDLKNCIKAFKIIKLIDTNVNEALCVVLIDGYRYNCWEEYGVQIMTLPLWYPDMLKTMGKETDPKTIDFYKEINQEDFDAMYKVYKQKIDEVNKQVLVEVKKEDDDD